MTVAMLMALILNILAAKSTTMVHVIMRTQMDNQMDDKVFDRLADEELRHLESKLGELDPDDVEFDLAQGVLTHPHVDHAAACVPLQKMHPIRVAAYEGVGKKYSEYYQLMKVAYDLFRPRCPHLLAAGYRPEELTAFARVYYLPPGPIGFRESLTEGSKIRMGDQDWEVFYTPGHSNEHILLLNPDGLGISGDLIVGRATSLGEIRVYLQTLGKLSRLPLKSLLPAHGSLISNPPKRIETARKTVEDLRSQALQLLEGPGLTFLDLTRAVMGDISKIHLASTSTGLIVSLLDEFQSDGLVRAEPAASAGNPSKVIYRKI